MSGGSYDYICYKIQEIEIRDAHLSPERAAFQKLLKLVGEAMHDIEWVDSSDYGKGDELESIKKVFAMLEFSPEMAIKAAAYDSLKEILQEYLK